MIILCHNLWNREFSWKSNFLPGPITLWRLFPQFATFPATFNCINVCDRLVHGPLVRGPVVNGPLDHLSVDQWSMDHLPVDQWSMDHFTKVGWSMGPPWFSILRFSLLIWFETFIELVYFDKRNTYKYNMDTKYYTAAYMTSGCRVGTNI